MTYYTFSLGCKVNSYECAAVAAIFNAHGAKQNKEHPDVVIINTCSITHVADQKSRQHIRKFKKLFPTAILVVMGCYAQGNQQEILDNSDADIIIGTSNRNEIYELVQEYQNNHQRIVKIDSNTRAYAYEELGVTNLSENVRAYLKIQDGCDNFCSYCIVPYRRGRSRSRAFDDVLLEANSLVFKGYREIVLTGIHIGGYGKDIGSSFSKLVKAILDIPGDFMVRISSIEESEIDDELINLLIHNNKLAKHLHVPLQSGSDTVLKRMNRKYDTKTFLTKMNYIRSYLPDICLTSDVIVGFPKESEQEFLETYSFIKAVGFNQLHVFPYSKREGTLAAKEKEQIDPKIKNERCDKLLSLSDELWQDYNSKFISKTLDVLIERYVDGFNIGHTSNYLEIKIKDDTSRVGQVVKVTICKNNLMQSK